MKQKRKMNPASLANLKPIQPGECRNPKGRTAGLKDALSYDFVAALKEDFEKHGVEAIGMAREESPLGYVKVIASLLPKDINLNKQDSVFDEMSVEELTAFIDAVRGSIVASSVDGKTEKASKPEPSTLH